MKISWLPRVLVVVFFSLGCSYLLFLLLLSRYHYQMGLDYFNQWELGKAQTALEKALVLLPGDEEYTLFVVDQQRICLVLGDVFFAKGGQTKTTEGFSLELISAARYYRRSLALNPYEVEAATGLARTVAAQQRLFALMYPDDTNPHQPQPVFERALQLRPNGISLHYYYASFLYFQEEEERLHKILRRLTTIHPSNYFQIIKEPYYTPEVRKAVKEGVLQAVDKGLYTRDTSSVLSAIALEEDDLSAAIKHYQDFLDTIPGKNTMQNHMKMGGLQLQADNKQKAGLHFLRALTLSDDRLAALRSIYKSYKRERRFQDFIDFTTIVEEKYSFSGHLDIHIAKCLFDSNQLELAKARLRGIEPGRYQAESLYLLAKIAEKEQDWGSMELAIQRATVLDPGNSGYHRLFASALTRQKKYARAEIEATKAIDTVSSPNPWYFNHRGWIRWSKKEYNGAIEDWKKAIQLIPERADFYYHVSLGYKALENYADAIDYARKANEYDPENVKYKKHLKSLQKNLTGLPAK